MLLSSSIQGRPPAPFILPAIVRAWAKRATTPRVRSMGGRLMRPAISSRQRASKGRSFDNFDSTNLASALRAMRTSICVSASAAITLLRVPP